MSELEIGRSIEYGEDIEGEGESTALICMYVVSRASHLPAELEQCLSTLD